jgi:3-oxoacyl-[acyl-carrier protein] reductase
VTGASRRQGIGAAVCRALAAHGADILFTHWQTYDGVHGSGVDAEGPSGLERELCAMGVRASSLEVDLSHPDAHVCVLDTVAERLGPPVVLVNNAAHSTSEGYER